MPLKTLVKAGNISNLSDARYCAGMGVNMLGFSVIEGKPDYVSPKLFQEIRGWISGPEIVAEIYGLESPDQLAGIIANYAPDYFELTDAEYEALAPHLTLPCIADITSFAKLPSKTEGIAYFLSGDINQITEKDRKVLLRVNSNISLLERIKHPAVAGIALSGSREARPGFKDYDELADILELLDE